MKFKVHSPYSPSGDQPQAIEELYQGIQKGIPHQNLLGVTGSGKTFTIANLVEKVQKPTLVLAHNKTLAAQLYQEFKDFFPDNAVEYFVSYYDYYQPEAYVPTTNTYIEKDLSINEDIEKLRISTTSSLLSGRQDVLVVASVSCLYGIGNPVEFQKNKITLEVGQEISRNDLLGRLVNALYSRAQNDFTRGQFRVRGDTIDIFPAYADDAFKITFWGDEVEEIRIFDPTDGQTISELDKVHIFPANIFVTSPDILQHAIVDIQDELTSRLQELQDLVKLPEAKRLQDRVEQDIEMMKELGYCSGIENYSRFMDGRVPGSRPFCLIDYFPDDFLTVIDESHVTLPQIRAMYGGDRSRKLNLVEFGFRLPSALDNRPLKFEEFEAIQKQMVFVSATPGDFELEKTMGTYTEQVIRPTGLLDPQILIRPIETQVDDLMEEIQKTIEKDQRILVTTLTKRMAEDLAQYLAKHQIRCRYIHSDVDTMERVEIMYDLRKGLFDVLIGVNLLREGLDLPEVSLVAILDADKEGFLRSYRSLIQTIGRAARNVDGRVIMYANKITDSMEKAIEETKRRREKQQDYNKLHNKQPKQIVKELRENLLTYSSKFMERKESELDKQADKVDYTQEDIPTLQEKMEEASANLDFIQAAKYRDLIKTLS